MSAMIDKSKSKRRNLIFTSLLIVFSAFSVTAQEEGSGITINTEKGKIKIGASQLADTPITSFVGFKYLKTSDKSGDVTGLLDVSKQDESFTEMYATYLQDELMTQILYVCGDSSNINMVSIDDEVGLTETPENMFPFQASRTMQVECVEKLAKGFNDKN